MTQVVAKMSDITGSSADLGRGYPAGAMTFRPVRIPDFAYRKARWATVREVNTEEMARQFADNPQLVTVLEDPKLRKNPLVVMRKEQLDQMLNLLRDLVAGHVGIEHDLTAVSSANELLSLIANEEGMLPGGLASESHLKLAHAIHLVLSTTRSVLQRRFVSVAHKAADDPFVLTPDEKEAISS